MSDVLELAAVETPTARYHKARVIMEGTTVRVLDRRHRELEVLEDLPERVALTADSWSYGDQITINKLTGCGCGGTRVSPKG